MKKILLLVLLAALVAAVGCNNHKAEIERLKTKNDSLMMLGFKQDTTLMDYIRAFNDIQSNLDSIKLKENIISQNVKGSELQTSAQAQINGDINSIYLLLKKNREIVANLRSKLKKSDVRILELEKMLENLNLQVEKKNTEISELRAELEKLNIKIDDLNQQVTNLNETVTSLDAENKKKEQIITDKTTELNTAWYVVGSSKELRERNIITKEGGFIGLGTSKTMKESFDKSYFTKIDIRNFPGVAVFKKTASVVTNHPKASYLFTGKKAVDSLVIKNPVEFWASSKYLVIIAE